MALKALTEDERTLVLKCLRVAADGPFISDAAFHSLFGLHRVDVAEIASEPNWEIGCSGRECWCWQ
jgi:hypothetical protein